ncbi:MAG: carboxymuconolactone decarboxylase family protein [Alphaproteobacteria bacterium]|nr:carboxymuconolactone decarboxylase family protein [Alphaproteobacteria bacterium]
MAETLPSGAATLAGNHPPVWDAYQELGAACAAAGPLDARTRRLVKLAIAIGQESEGAVHSHTRRALSEGLGKDEIRHVTLLAIPSMGLAKAAAGMTWVGDILDR